MSDIEERLVAAVRTILGRTGVFSTIHTYKATIYLSGDDEAQTLVQALESIAEQDQRLRLLEELLSKARNRIAEFEMKIACVAAGERSQYEAALGKVIVESLTTAVPYDNTWYTFHTTADWKTCDKCGMKWPCPTAERESI